MSSAIAHQGPPKSRFHLELPTFRFPSGWEPDKKFRFHPELPTFRFPSGWEPDKKSRFHPELPTFRFPSGWEPDKKFRFHPELPTFWFPSGWDPDFWGGIKLLLTPSFCRNPAGNWWLPGGRPEPPWDRARSPARRSSGWRSAGSHRRLSYRWQCGRCTCAAANQPWH